MTAWAKKRWSSHQALAVGLCLMGLAFVPLAFTPDDAPVLALTALVAAVVLLAVGGAIIYPFEMETVVVLCDNRLVATHYGLYNTVSGLGISASPWATWPSEPYGTSRRVIGRSG
ncbi:hypothetical protein AB0H24_16760 [Streptomyces globisporus]|uniref:hypothetical protein n=1 Tax=Streptomyces globisporus TaxID=1908 RepID=UPI0034617441